MKEATRSAIDQSIDLVSDLIRGIEDGEVAMIAHARLYVVGA